MMNLPIGIQSFREIRENGYAYVDKTAYIVPLLHNGKYKFLSRPRRFGKSLLISMLESFFKGEKELFRGLEIERLMPGPWEVHPVIHLDFSGENYTGSSVLDDKLDASLALYESGLGLAPTGTFSERLRSIVRTLRQTTGSRVVVLIDEYDNPITSTIGNPALQDCLRAILYGFYSSLKSLDEHLHFCMLTGVTKYGHLSVFNGLNNLLDISLLDDFAGICGVTEEELHTALREPVATLAASEGEDIDSIYGILKEWYDGYHFSKSMLDVYNPFSVMNALSNREISDYWYQSGKPTMLINMLKRHSLDIRNLNGARASIGMLGNISAMNINPVALFYQTGYLTIKSYDRQTRLFRLGYPNKEVETGLMDNLLNEYGNIPDSHVLVSDLKAYLENGEIKKFIETLTSFFANIPFDLRRNVEKFENYYHTVLYVLLRLIGMDTDAEYHTSEGSIDILIKTARFIYVMELKINGTAEDAMRQIASRHYSAPFESDGRRIIKVGIGFAEETHTIDSYIVEAGA